MLLGCSHLLLRAFLIPAMAHLVERRSLTSAKDQIAVMDPSFKDYFDKLSNSLEGIHANIHSNTAMIQATTARLDDIVQWCPDLERRVGVAPLASALWWFIDGLVLGPRRLFGQEYPPCIHRRLKWPSNIL